MFFAKNDVPRKRLGLIFMAASITTCSCHNLDDQDNEYALRTTPAELHDASKHKPTMERTIITELDDASGHTPTKCNRTKDLSHARSLLDGLLARGASGGSKEDLKDYTEVLSIVVDALSAMGMHDRVNTSVDCGTAVTLPESVVSEHEYSPHIVEVVDGSYEVRYAEASLDDDDHWNYTETKDFQKKRNAEDRNEAGDDAEDQKEDGDDTEDASDARDDDIFLIDETELTQVLGGYEEGFYPKRCDRLGEEDFESHSVGFDSTKNGRGRKAAASVRSEGSQCFYCLKHGDGEKCSGTKFCI